MSSPWPVSIVGPAFGEMRRRPTEPVKGPRMRAKVPRLEPCPRPRGDPRPAPQTKWPYASCWGHLCPPIPRPSGPQSWSRGGPARAGWADPHSHQDCVAGEGAGRGRCRWPPGRRTRRKAVTPWPVAAVRPHNAPQASWRGQRPGLLGEACESMPVTPAALALGVGTRGGAVHGWPMQPPSTDRHGSRASPSGRRARTASPWSHHLGARLKSLQSRLATGPIGCPSSHAALLMGDSQLT